MPPRKRGGHSQMGRPRGTGGPPEQVRRNRVVVMLTDDELAKLTKLADERELPLGTTAVREIIEAGQPQWVRRWHRGRLDGGLNGRKRLSWWRLRHRFGLAAAAAGDHRDHSDPREAENPARNALKLLPRSHPPWCA